MPIRVLLVEDSAAMRSFVGSVLDAVVAIAGGGGGGVPALIEKALAGDYAQDPTKRDLQHEAQRQPDQRFRRDREGQPR